MTITKVNVLSLISVGAGALAVSVPWFGIRSVFSGPVLVPLGVVTGELGHVDALLWLSFVFVLTGVICMLVTPLGGFLQATGFAVFFCYYVPEYAGWYPNSEDTLVLGLGSYLGFLSASIAIASFLRPLGFNIGPPACLRSAVFTFDPRKQTVTNPTLSSSSGRIEMKTTFAVLSLVSGAGAVVHAILASVMRAGSFPWVHYEIHWLYVKAGIGAMFAVIGAFFLLEIHRSRLPRKSLIG